MRRLRPPSPISTATAGGRPSRRFGKFGFDVLACARCDGRMPLLAMVTDPKSVARYLGALGEPTLRRARSLSKRPRIVWSLRLTCRRSAP
jgi:hypothetical protein